MPLTAALQRTLDARQSAQWRLLFQRAGYRVFVDRKSIERGTITRAILRYEYTWLVTPNDGWPAYRSSIERRQFNLPAETSGVEHSIVFLEPGAKGAPLRAEAFVSVPLVRPEAGTVGAAVIEALAKELAH